MVDDTDAWILGREPIGDLAGAVLRRVIDDDHLEVVGVCRHGRERLAHDGLDIPLLVVRREEHREGRKSCGQDESRLAFRTH